MSSHHDDHHHHSHNHDHGHDHHQEESNRELSFNEKLAIIFEHWIRHNESHGQTYLDWRDKAKAQGLDRIAGLLEEIAVLSDRLTEKLKAGLDEANKADA